MQDVESGLLRCQVTLACFLAGLLLLALFPGVDLFVSGLFFNDGFAWKDAPAQRFLQRLPGWLLILSMTSVLVVYAIGRSTRRQIWGIDGRKVIYLFAVLIVGAGLIVNTGLKDHMGRARPRDVAEFGGSRQFTPVFVASHECSRNCSFPSGDAAAGFFFLAFAKVMRRRREWFVAAVSAGVLFSLSRIAAGAHFLSDAVAACFIMWLVAEILYRYIVLPGSALARVPYPRAEAPLKRTRAPGA